MGKPRKPLPSWVPDPPVERASGPLTDVEKGVIHRLHADDYGRNEIADALNRHWSTITRFCQREGLSFVNTEAMVGVMERRRAASQRRAELILALLDDATRLRDQMFSQMTYLPRFRGDSSHDLPEPVPQDKSHLARAITGLIEATMRMEVHDRQTDPDAAKAALGTLGAWIQDAASKAYVPPSPDDQAGDLDEDDGQEPDLDIDREVS